MKPAQKADIRRVKNELQGKPITRTLVASYTMPFIHLLDCPASYTGQAGKAAVANSEESGLVFKSAREFVGRSFFVSDFPPTPDDGQDGDIWFEY
jgi:hypothetical protein